MLFFLNKKIISTKKCGDSAASHVATLNTRLLCRGAVEQNSFCSSNSERPVALRVSFVPDNSHDPRGLLSSRLRWLPCWSRTKSYPNNVAGWGPVTPSSSSSSSCVSFFCTRCFLPPAHIPFISFSHFVPFISSFQDSPCPPPLPCLGGILRLTAC